MMNLTISGKFSNPRRKNFVAATKWKVIGHLTHSAPNSFSWTVLGFCGFCVCYLALGTLWKPDKSLFKEGTCWMFCSAFPLGVCKYVTLPFSKGHRTSPRNYRNGEIICNCLFRAEVKVLRKSVISCLSLISANRRLLFPYFCRADETKRKEHFKRPASLYVASIWLEGKEKWGTSHEGKSSALINLNWQYLSSRILPTMHLQGAQTRLL